MEDESGKTYEKSVEHRREWQKMTKKRKTKVRWKGGIKQYNERLVRIT